MDTLQTAYYACAIKPDIIVISNAMWTEYEMNLSPPIRADYDEHGFYRVHARKEKRLRRRIKPFTPSIVAIMYKGTPVVRAFDYGALMLGHRSKRVVCQI